jgi:hypothetical protein
MNLSLSQAIEEAVETLTAFSIPLYRDDEYGKPSLHGTGFFVRRGEDHFFVTAAHVIDTALPDDLYFYTNKTTIRKLSGNVHRTNGAADRNNDLIDVAVLKLTGNPVPPYPEAHKCAMDIEYLHPRLLPRDKRSYVVVGFPATKSKAQKSNRTILTAPYAYRCEPYRDDEYGRHGLDPDTHLALRLNLKVGFDSEGKHQHFPKPQGMSGSPVIVLYSLTENERSRVFPVVGIATRYRPSDKVLIATDIAYALDLINHAV